jgi:hypothetical protein
MGEATRLVNHLLQHPLTPEEAEESRRPLGPIRLRVDAPALEVDKSTSAQKILDQTREYDRIVTIKGSSGEVEAVIMPVDWYVRLAHASLRDRENMAPVRDMELPNLYLEEVSEGNPEAPGVAHQQPSV